MEHPYKKFEEVYEIEEYEIKTPQGWKSISNIMKTIPYETWYIELENGESLKGADTHILYTINHEEIFLKDIKIGQLIETDSGFYKVKKLKNLNLFDNMYDVEVNSFEHEYYSNSFISHNTTTVGIFLVWFAFFNSEKTIGILAHKADMAKAILAEIKYAIEEMPEFLKPGVVEYNAFNIKFDNKCEIIAKATSANSLRGETIHLLLLDEFAFVPNNIALDFWNTTYPTLSTSKGKCIIVSTPNGTSNLYYDLWKKALDKRNTFKNIRIDWWQVPGRDEAWKEKTIKNLGSLVRFNQEFGNSFIGSTVTLIDGRFITENLKAETPIYESKDTYTKVWKEPQIGRKYLFSIDTAGGVGSDSSIIDVYDITDFPSGGVCEQVAIYQNNTIAPPAFAQYIFDSCEDWNNPYIVGELNGLSAQVIDRLFNDFEYENLYYDYDDETFGLTADKKSKPQAAVWYKEYLENGRILLKNSETINQIGYFEEVKPGVYKAKEGRNNHDDCVMTGLWASYFLKSKFFEDEKDTWSYEEDETENSEVYNKEAEDSLEAFLENDALTYGDDWLENEEMNRYKRQEN